MGTPSRYQLSYYLLFVGAMLFIGSVGLLIVRSIPELVTFSGQALNPIAETCGCGHYFSFSQHPWFWGTTILLGMISAIAVLVIVFFLARDFQRTNTFLRSLPVYRRKKFFIGKKSVSVRIIDSSKTICFTAGLWKPQIYLSLGVLNHLNPMETKSVLLHEYAHVVRRDPLTRWLLRGILVPLASIIPLSRVENIISTYQEQRADQFVLQRQSKKGLVSAFLKMTEQPSMDLRVAHFSTDEARLQILLGYRSTFPFVFLMSGVVSILVLLSVVNIAFAQGVSLLETFSEDSHGAMTPGRCEEQISQSRMLMSQDPLSQETWGEHSCSMSEHEAMSYLP